MEWSSLMPKINVHVPVGPNGEELVEPGQLRAVYSGSREVLRRLGKLASVVTQIRVEFVCRSHTPGVYGPAFQVYCVDQVGKESWHGASWEFMGPRGTRSKNPTPSAKRIADRLCEESCLPYFIRGLLTRGAKELARTNTTSKDLGKTDGFRLESSDPQKDVDFFAADSREGALALVAGALNIPHPMTEEAFLAAGGKAVYANFTNQIFPPAKVTTVT